MSDTSARDSLRDQARDNARDRDNAMTVAKWLSGHPTVAWVSYPGLASHPSHAVAARQMQRGFGGMLSIRVGGGPEVAVGVIQRLHVWVAATSLARDRSPELIVLSSSALKRR